jgi:tetratricopeptide (TPR) repeat protein
MSAEIGAIQRAVITNICVIHTKSKAWKEVLRYANEALEIDPNYTKALYHKGRSQIELTEYQSAIEALSLALKLDPGN